MILNVQYSEQLKAALPHLSQEHIATLNAALL